MECRYCQAWNEADEHRCCHCGRRLRPAAARPAPDTYPISTSPAPALSELYVPLPEEAPARVAERRPQPDGIVYQRSLFRELPQVIPLPKSTSQQTTDARVSSPKAVRAPRQSRRISENQQSLEFVPPTPRSTKNAAEPVIYCDAPVALPTHRVMATALDWSMIVAALGLFLLTFQFFGGDVVLNKHTVPLFCGIALVLGLFYHFLFCICGGDTAGMHWTQLRLLNFDGQSPDREQRAYRLVGGCVSLLAAGLGLIWALVDEESLTWHDHMSKTFPSPYQRENP